MGPRHAADWLAEIFYEDSRKFARRAPRLLGLLAKVLMVGPHLFAMAFTNFASTYPRAEKSADPDPLPADENISIVIGSWPINPGTSGDRGLPYSDSVIASVDLQESLSSVEDLVFALKEVHRICLPGASVVLQLVSVERALADPTLRRAVVSDTIEFFTDALQSEPLGRKAAALSARSLFAIQHADENRMDLRAIKQEATSLRPTRIDLGCGTQVHPGYTGVDLLPLPGVGIVRDVDRHGLPLSDSTLSHVYTAHFLEHVQNLVFVMNEIHRVCCHDAIVEISVPTLLGPHSAADPTHVHLFNARTLSYFEAGSGEYAGITKGFEILEQRVGFSLEARLRVVKRDG